MYFGFFSMFCPKLRGFTFWLDEYLPKFGNFGGRQTQTVVVANKSLCTNHSSRMRVLVQLWHITLVRAIHANNKCFVVSFPRLAPKLNVLEVEEALLLPSTYTSWRTLVAKSHHLGKKFFVQSKVLHGESNQTKFLLEIHCTYIILQ